MVGMAGSLPAMVTMVTMVTRRSRGLMMAGTWSLLVTGVDTGEDEESL